MKVAVYFATGYEEIEALATVDVLRRAGIETLMVGVTGKTVVSTHNIGMNMDVLIEEVNHEEIDMMVLPGGGPGYKNLAANDTLVKALKNFKEEGKWIAAICAAPSILGNLGLLVGEKATCFPGFEDQLLGCEVQNERVVVSHKIITGVGAGASLEFAYKILEVLRGNEVAKEMKEKMLFRG